jgi:hypothetical protein
MDKRDYCFKQYFILLYWTIFFGVIQNAIYIRSVVEFERGNLIAVKKNCTWSWRLYVAIPRSQTLRVIYNAACVLCSYIYLYLYLSIYIDRYRYYRRWHLCLMAHGLLCLWEIWSLKRVWGYQFQGRLRELYHVLIFLFCLDFQQIARREAQRIVIRFRQYRGRKNRDVKREALMDHTIPFRSNLKYTKGANSLYYVTWKGANIFQICNIIIICDTSSYRRWNISW